MGEADPFTGDLWSIWSVWPSYTIRFFPEHNCSPTSDQDSRLLGKPDSWQAGTGTGSLTHRRRCLRQKGRARPPSKFYEKHHKKGLEWPKGVAQLVEYLCSMHEVLGSIPDTCSIMPCKDGSTCLQRLKPGAAGVQHIPVWPSLPM